MLKSFINKNLEFDEAVIHIIRPSWKRYIFRIFRNGALILASFFLLYPLSTFGSIGFIIFIIAVAWGVCGLAVVFLLRNMHAAIITNKRIIDIDQHSLFQRFVAECDLEHIQDIRYNTKGLLDTVFHAGTLIIDTGNSATHIELQDIIQPEQVKALIINTQRNRTKSGNKIQESS